MYTKQARPTCTITPILHVRKTPFSYTHSRGNSACTHMALGGSGPPCTKNIPHLHTLGPQLSMYTKQARPTYTITPILHVRKTRLAYGLFTLDTAFIALTPLLWFVYLGYRVHSINAVAMVCLFWIPSS